MKLSRWSKKNPHPRMPARKYHFMLGTTSRVPGAPGWHYLIADIDTKQTLQKIALPLPVQIEETESGYHIYTNRVFRLKQMLQHARKHFGADRTWARLALKRGWAFLADKGEVKIPWPVERMVIGWRPFSKTNQSRLEFLNDKTLDNKPRRKHHTK